MINRRSWLGGAAAGAAGALLAPRLAFGDDALPPEADTSALIYVTPIKSNGEESSCQAEVWFARAGSSLYVVTAADAWRARAVGRGLTSTRIWVGDVGVWSSAGRYRKLPAVTARSSLVTDPAAREPVLEIMGTKYSGEWRTWGPRFRNGLADGSRVMIRYEVG